MELISSENLTFPPSFFEDEVREGFYISSMMKRYWASQLKVLSVIADICKKHDIRWFAEYGTMMGAVRHGGYIPWDDDLDILMLREDFNRFFEVAKGEVPEDYQLLTIKGAPGYEEITGRVVNSGSIDYSPGHLKEYYGCPYTVGVDIFPLDGVYNDPAKEKYRNERAKKVLEKLNGSSGKRKHELLCEIERIYSECPTKGAKNLALMPFYISHGHHLFPHELYRDCIEMPFENTSVNVVARYEELLELEYGNYLDINKHGGMHDYPCYCEQEQILKDNIGRNPYRYTLDYNELLRSVQRYVKRLSLAMVGDTPSEYTAKTSKKKVVFLPCKAKWWSTMEPLWKAYSNSPEYEVHVLPIFYYDSDFNGGVYDRHDERDLFPGYLHVEPCEKFDFETIHPEVIVTQVPYDGYSTTMTVHEYFYSSNLLNYTDELVYVPCMDMDAPAEEGDKASVAVSVFIEQEGVINADRIVIADKALRDFYEKKLTGMTGADTAKYWEQKIVRLEDEVKRLSGLPEASGKEADNTSAPEEGTKPDRDSAWNEFLGSYSGRKVVVYHITISFLLRDRTKSVDKISRSIETFANAGDKICAIIVPQKQILADLERIDMDLWERYLDLTDIIRKSQNCIYDEGGFTLDFMEKWNGYYGDADPLVRKCVLKNIPVMIENIDV
jgi:phosphorylcholine metabolism protein LicD